MKKIVILKHGGGELANQLWNYLSVYAYGLEIGAPVRNPSFFEYHYFFRFLQDEGWVTRLISRLLFRIPRRRNSLITKSQRFKYAQRAWITAKLRAACVYSSENNENKQTYLPPSSELPARFQNCGHIYLTGWLFRNPRGLIKFKSELHSAFAPTAAVLDSVDAIIAPLRKEYSKIVGIHIRQADYKEFKDGKFMVSQERIRAIIDEYISKNHIDLDSALFLIASDGPVDESMFKGINVHISRENSVTDLFLLSRTDVIIGSDSSFGAFAAWYGDIPHIICKNESIDWAYYADKNTFFENKYSELARY